jgi:hypothetical protein
LGCAFIGNGHYPSSWLFGLSGCLNPGGGENNLLPEIRPDIDKYGGLRMLTGRCGSGHHRVKRTLEPA